MIEHLSMNIEPAITIMYLAIAIDFYSHSNDPKIKKSNKDAIKAILYMCIIFILCGITRLLHYMHSPIMDKVSLVLHISLLIVTIVYYSTKQTRKILKAFE